MSVNLEVCLSTKKIKWMRDKLKIFISKLRGFGTLSLSFSHTHTKTKTKKKKKNQISFSQNGKKKKNHD